MSLEYNNCYSYTNIVEPFSIIRFDYWKKNKVELELKGPQKPKPYKNQTASRSYFVLLRFLNSNLKLCTVFKMKQIN